MIKLAIAIAICACACLAPGARADIYTFTDEHGIKHFTNVPTDPRYRLLYRSTKQGLTRSAPSPTVPRVDVRSQRRYQALVDEAARAHQIDKALLHAVIAVESGYNARAVSRKGAVGLMQLMPETGKRYGVRDLYDPAQNVSAGARYLRDLLKRFNDVRLALAAYNAGEQAIAKYGNRIPPYQETLLYIPRVMHLYRQYQRQT
jgi:soluble lytic murein transglycosylase-like protein